MKEVNLFYSDRLRIKGFLGGDFSVLLYRDGVWEAVHKDMNLTDAKKVAEWVYHTLENTTVKT